jgi:hypothetical protein
VRILFSVNNLGFLRNFEPALHLLASHGHDIHVVADRKDSVGGGRTLENLQRAYPDRVRLAEAPGRKEAFWQPLAVQLRLCLDYWRYLDRRYDRSPSLRDRAARQGPAFARRLPRVPVIGSRPAMRLWQRLFRLFERAMPPGNTLERFLREQKPDLLLLTPLLYFGSQQVDYVRAARRLGIRTVLGVGSWDHLTTKGCIHELPDRLVVWNEFQRREAYELHGIEPDRVTVTGAQAYDHWFSQSPSSSRAAFRAKVGLPEDDRPLLLYLCSSPFITPYEVGFVRRWIAAIRASVEPELRRAALLIRPHPQNAEQWETFDAGEHEAVAVWPRGGANPVDTDARAEYYDSMYHSVAVVGVNTSALIESAIVGRPVYTALADEFTGQQEGTLHFQHLKNANGGLLHLASNLDEHVTQLSAALRSPDTVRSRAFVEAFVRPHGLESPAAERFVRVLESEAERPAPRPRADTPGAALRRVVLRPVAALVRRDQRLRRGKRQDAARAASPAGEPLRFLFVLSSPEYLRYFDSTLQLLVDRGHQVSVGVNWLREKKHARLDELVGDARIEVLGAIPPRVDIWGAFARAVRGTTDFVRYLDPRFADAPALRARFHRKALPPILGPLNRIRTLTDTARRRTLTALAWCERAVPVDRRLRPLLDAQRPDALVISPLVDAASDQVDTVRAAQAAGVPVVAAIASWDNLTNKGLLRVQPDLVTVWNDQQKHEAITMHGVAPERVAVTGAQLFDRWFEKAPSQSRAAFCELVGLPGDDPFILFTGSSIFIARSEVEVPFVRRWLAAIRASSDPALRTMPVLIRPHPFNCVSWATADLSDLGPVAVWPRTRYTPAAEWARTSFFDSLFHSAAVVGINTSAMIEAAILRKPVFSLLTPDFAATQEGTLHFRYLLPENGGFLRVARSIDEHLGQLGNVLRNPEESREEAGKFVASFLRPHGVTIRATPILADALERAARGPRPTVAREGLAVWTLRASLLPLAAGVKWLHLTEDIPALLRRKIYETRGTLGRTRRIVVKRAVVRPARAVRRGVALVSRTVRKAARPGPLT